MCGFDPSKAEEVPGLKVEGLDALLLEDSGTPECLKKEIRDQINAQKGFKVQTEKGEIQFVIGPFRDGFECWFVDRKTGYALRI